MALLGSAGNEIDNTTYTDDKIPELQVKSLFASLRIPEKWRKALAEKEFLLVENICTLGSTEDSFVARVKKIFTSSLDSDPGVQEIEMTKLMALWQACRDIRQQRSDQRTRLAEDPKKVPEIPQVERAVLRMKTRERNKEILWNEFTTPHDKFEDLVRRDVLVNGMVPFYEIYQIRLKCDKIQSTPMLTRDVKKLLAVADQEDYAQITTEESALNRVQALYLVLDTLGIQVFDEATGSRRYVHELKNFSARNPGLAYLLKADKLIREKTFELQVSQPDKFKTQSEALLHVLNNEKHLWDSAISRVEAQRYQQVFEQYQGGGSLGQREKVPGEEAPPGSAQEKLEAMIKAKRDKKARQRESKKKRALEGGDHPSPKKTARPSQGGKGDTSKGLGKGANEKRLVPKNEWDQIVQLATKRGGKKVCQWYNSSKGCRFGDSCRDLHECLICPGEKHSWAIKH